MYLQICFLFAKIFVILQTLFVVVEGILYLHITHLHKDCQSVHPNNREKRKIYLPTSRVIDHFLRHLYDRLKEPVKANLVWVDTRVITVKGMGRVRRGGLTP